MNKLTTVVYLLCSAVVCLAADCSKPSYDACKPARNDLIADPSDVHRFYQCDNGLVVGHAIQCPTVGKESMTFVADRQTCLAAQDVKECYTENDTFPDPSANNKYFICKNGKKVSQTCYPDYLYYDPDQKTCMK